MSMFVIPSNENAKKKNARLKALQEKHSAISQKLEKARKRPSTADFYLTQLKKQKLILKDAIESLVRDSANQSSRAEETTA